MDTVARRLDTAELEERVKRMYQEVALEPEHEFHFETGRPLAERLGYPTEDVDRFGFAAQRFEPSIPHLLGRARRA